MAYVSNVPRAVQLVAVRMAWKLGFVIRASGLRLRAAFEKKQGPQNQSHGVGLTQPSTADEVYALNLPIRHNSSEHPPCAQYLCHGGVGLRCKKSACCFAL